MREIVFRGKRIANGEWIEGYITEHTMITHDMQSYIGWVIECKKTELYEYNWYEVDPVTVGQYTGLKDKNGKRIFEGDIVTRILFDKLYQYEVAYQPGYASFDGIRKGGFISFGNDGDCFEVIGNIHDNPELLEVR